MSTVISQLRIDVVVPVGLGKSRGQPIEWTPADELERLLARHTFWITAIGLVGVLAAFVLVVVLFQNNTDATKLIPAVLGVLFTAIGTILGRIQGGATGRSAASRAHGEAETLRAQLRAYESTLPGDATRKVRLANPAIFPNDPTQ